MHIACVKNHGIPYLQVMENYSEIVDGVRKNKKRTLMNIGPLSRFDDGKPDYLKRLRESFKNSHPIIPELSTFLKSMSVPIKTRVEFDVSKPGDCQFNPKNIGYFLLDGLYDSLGIYSVMNLHKSRRKIKFDINNYTRRLIFGKALLSNAKRAAAFQGNGNNRYLFIDASSGSPEDICQTLDYLDDRAKAIQKRMNLKINASVGNNFEESYYYLTNYCVEVENNGDAKNNTNGQRYKQTVQMGLFTDANGMPASYQLFPGNGSDKSSLFPSLAEIVSDIRPERVVVVADSKVSSDQNIAQILNAGNGYIMSRNAKKADKAAKKWILDESGYEWNGSKTFKMKSSIFTRTINTEGGGTRKVTEKLICYWSKRYYDKERHESARFMEYLNSVASKTDSGAVFNKTKIQQYNDLLGYHTIITSELDKSEKEIISKFQALTRIEDAFKLTKGTPDNKPVSIKKPEHINAHFLLNYIVLTMLRMIQSRICSSLGKALPDPYCQKSNASTDRIQEALAMWCADPLPGGYYRLTAYNDDLNMILSSYGIKGDLRIPSTKELYTLKSRFDNAVSGNGDNGLADADTNDEVCCAAGAAEEAPDAEATEEAAAAAIALLT